MSEIAEDRLLAERATGIGGSDVHHALSEPPYGCARQLFYLKRPVARDYEETEFEKRRMYRGQRLEPIAAEEYADVTGRKLARTQVKRDPKHRHRLVHVDRMQLSVADPPQGLRTKTAPLELKVPGEAAFKRIALDGLPTAYILQMQWALGITGHAWGSFGIFHADSWQLLHFDVALNPALVAEITAHIDDLWAKIQRGEEPPRLEAGDPRCGRCPWRRTCWGDRLMEMLRVPKDEQKSVRGLPVADDLAPIVADYREAKEVVAQHEALRDSIAGALKARLEERGLDAVQVDGRPVYYRLQKASVMLDADAIRRGGKPRFVEWLYKHFGKARAASRPLRIY